MEPNLPTMLVPKQPTTDLAFAQAKSSAYTRVIRFGVVALGVSSVVAQLTLLRELLAAFQGNELALGVFLGNWLLLTGVGAALGRRAKSGPQGELHLLVGQMLVAVTPMAGMIALRVLRDAVLVRGAAAGIVTATIGSLVVLAPFCVVSGYLLALSVAMLDRVEGGRGLGTVYVADSVGSVAGGVLFTYILSRWLDHFGILWCAAWLNLLLAGVCAVAWRRGVSAVIAGMLAAGWAVLWMSGVDNWSTRVQFSGQELVFVGNSPYGRVVVTESDGQLNVSESGLTKPLAGDVTQIEETVLCAMAQRPDARRVLLLGGAVSGSARFLIDQGVERVTCVELDPLLIQIGRRFMPENLEDARIEVLAGDGRKHLRETTNRYDIVIIDISDPVTSQLNRFYTLECFREVKKVLNPGGVVSFGLGRYENTLSQDLENLLAVARRTVGDVFGHVLMLPLGKVFFVASDGMLDPDVAGRLRERRRPVQWMKESYVKAMLSADRMADMERAAAKAAMLNTDSRPVLYFHHLQHWLSQFPRLPISVMLLIGLAVVVYVWRLAAVPRAVLASGMAATALEVVLLLAVQAACGSLYQQMGLVVVVFMAGLAVGGWWGCGAMRSGSRRGLGLLVLVLGSYAVLLPWFLQWAAGGAPAVLGYSASMVMILVLAALLALLVGAIFPLSGRAMAGGTTALASRLYTADFVGAWFGAALAGAVLVPLLGVSGMCRAVAVLVLVCGMGPMGRRDE